MTGLAAPNRRHLALGEVGSTNSVALDAARAGDPGRLWVTAARQSAGRGRRNRPWVSEAGNLYASLLLIDPAPLEDMMNLPLVAAVGIRQGLAELAGTAPVRFTIKWPNDILAPAGKCAGILVESERLAGGRLAVVVGFGVNVAHVPGDLPYAVTSLHREGIDAPLAAVFACAAAGLEDALSRWRSGRDFAAIRMSWLEHAAGLGAPCTVNLPDGAVAGVFETIDETGRMVLIGADGARRAISAGDLFFSALGEQAGNTSGEARRP